MVGLVDVVALSTLGGAGTESRAWDESEVCSGEEATGSSASSAKEEMGEDKGMEREDVANEETGAKGV